MSEFSNNELKLMAKEVEARMFFEHKGMAVIKKEKLNALYSVFHTVEFFIRFDNGALPEGLKKIYSENIEVMQQ